MGLSKDIFETEVRLTSNQALAELKKLESQTSGLRREQERLKKQRDGLIALGKKESDEYKQITKLIAANSKEIRGNEERMKGLRSTIGVTAMSMKDLKTRARELAKDLNNTSKSANSKEYAKLEKELAGVENQMEKLKSGTHKTNGILTSFKAILPALGVAALAAGVKKLVGSIIEVRKEFEKYEAVLANTLGSQDAARREMSMLKELAASTPFSLQELTGAYVKLVNQGFKPSQDEMTKMGDLAAALGKEFDMLAEAILDARVGEFERLKEFGIRAEKHGDKVKFSFKGITEEVDFTDQAIQKYILSLGELEGVSGSMEEISATLGGRISNLGDAWDNFLDSMGSRTSGVFISVINWLISFIDKLSLASKSIAQIKQMVLDDATRQNLRDGLDEINVMTDSLVKNGMKRADAQKRARELYLQELDLQISGTKERYQQASVSEKDHLNTRLNLLIQERNAMEDHFKQLALIESSKVSQENKKGKVTDELDRQHREQMVKIKSQFLEKEQTEEWYHTQMLVSEMAYLKAKQTLLESAGEDSTEVQLKLAEIEIRIKEDTIEAIQALDAENAKFLEDLEKDVTKGFEAGMDKQMQALVKKYSLEQKLRDKNRKEEENEINRKIDRYNDYAAAVGEVLGEAVADGQLTFQEFGKQIILVGLDILRKQMHLLIAKITAESLASAESIATWGVAGAAKAAALTLAVEVAYGAAKSAVLSSGKKDYYSGGYTPEGLWNQPQGVVHSDEWVGNRFAVRNPEVRQFLDVFDLAQRTGQVNQLNTDAILRAVEIKRGGFAGGGYTPTKTSPEPVGFNSFPDIEKLLSANLAMMAQVIKSHESPAKVEFLQMKRIEGEYEAVKRLVNLG